MNGIDKILGRIIADARASGDELIAEARGEAAELLSEYGRRAEEITSAAAERSARECALIEERAKASALTARRDRLLSERGRLVDEAFETALGVFSRLPDDEYAEFLEKLLNAAVARSIDGEAALAAASDDDVPPEPATEYAVRFSARDRGRVGARVVNSVRALAADGGKTIVLSDSPAAIRGGFILVCGDTELNCSLESICADLRPSLEGEAAKRMFGTE